MVWEGLSDLIRYRIGESQGRPTIALAGELDLLSAQPVRRLLRRHLSPGVLSVLDLSRVTFVDATGLSVLLQTARRARTMHAGLVIRRPSRSVTRLLDLSGLTDAFEYETPDWHVPSPDVAAILGEAVEGAIRISGAFGGNAQLPDSFGALRIVAERGLSRPFLTYFESVEEEESACGKALATGGSVWVSDVTTSPIFAETPAIDVLLDAGARAVVSLPIHAPDGPLMAVLSVHHDVPTAWSSEQIMRLHCHVQAAGFILAAQVA